MKHNMPWVEKYRPQKLDDVMQQEEIVGILKGCIKNKTMPHMIFYGQAGSGKTSTIISFALDLFGPKLFKQRVLELNASDERGIATVRKTITSFAKRGIGNPDPNYPSPSF